MVSCGFQSLLVILYLCMALLGLLLLHCFLSCRKAGALLQRSPQPQ